jgi:hypothetical protein
MLLNPETLQGPPRLAVHSSLGQTARLAEVTTELVAGNIAAELRPEMDGMARLCARWSNRRLGWLRATRCKSALPRRDRLCSAYAHCKLFAMVA